MFFFYHFVEYIVNRDFNVVSFLLWCFSFFIRKHKYFFRRSKTRFRARYRIHIGVQKILKKNKDKLRENWGEISKCVCKLKDNVLEFLLTIDQLSRLEMLIFHADLTEYKSQIKI